MRPTKSRVRGCSAPNRFALGTLVLIIALLGPESLFGDVLYNVDFEAPTHTVGQAPTLGQGPVPRNTPTSVFEPTLPPIVVNTPGILDGQSLHFTPTPIPGTPPYCQVEFGLDSDAGGIMQQFPAYRFQMDILFPSGLNSGNFAVFFDGPIAHHLNFVGGQYGVLAVGPNGYSQYFGSVIAGQRMAFDVLVDRAQQQLTVSLNGQPKFLGAYPLDTFETGMRSMRLSLNGGADVYVDNIRIQGVPEPATLMLVAFGSGLVATRRRAQARGSRVPASRTPRSS